MLVLVSDRSGKPLLYTVQSLYSQLDWLLQRLFPATMVRQESIKLSFIEGNIDTLKQALEIYSKR